MPGLADFQQQFVAAVLRRAGAGAVDWLGEAGADRLAVYRINARENFAAALESAFPALLALQGPEEFRRMAWAYQRAHPSPAGNLFHVGERLPGFLGQHLAGTAEARLADLARLEWAVQEALVAGDAGGRLDLAALGQIEPELQPRLQFQPHPALRLIDTAWPVLDAWEATQRGAAAPPAAGELAERLLVSRSQAGIGIRRLGPREYAGLRALLDGTVLPDVLAAVALADADADADADAGQLLRDWAERGIIVGFLVADGAMPGAAR